MLYNVEHGLDVGFLGVKFMIIPLVISLPTIAFITSETNVSVSRKAGLKNGK